MFQTRFEGKLPADDAGEELASLSPLLAGLPKGNPFSLPEDYFQKNLAMPPVAASEDDVLPAWLQQKVATPYTVPEGYFQTVSPAVLQQVAPRKEPAKVVSMFSRSWVRYAALAVVMGAVALGSFFYFGGNQQAMSLADGAQQWVEKKLQNVSSDELDDFIETAELASIKPVQKKNYAQPEVRKLLQDVSVSELDAFLDQLPEGEEYLN